MATKEVLFASDKLKITIYQEFCSYEGFNFGGIPRVTRTFPVGAPKIIKELTQDELEQYFNDYAQSKDEKILKDALRLKKKVQKIFKIK
jgi:hypothetical protein